MKNESMLRRMVENEEKAMKILQDKKFMKEFGQYFKTACCKRTNCLDLFEDKKTLGYEPCISQEYANQVVLIKRTIQNHHKIDKLYNQIHSFKTTEDLRFFEELLYNALIAYSNAKDTPKIDELNKEANELVERSIVFRIKNGGPRHTFHIVNRKDLKNPEFDENGFKKTQEQRRNEVLQNFKALKDEAFADNERTK